MKIHLASVFDINFLTRALALYSSATRFIPDLTFWFLCLDKESKTILDQLGLKNLNPVYIENIGDTELISLRGKRTRAEFAFTSKSAFLSYLVEKKLVANDDILFFADADIYFYSDINEVLTKISENSICITKHDFPEYKKTKGEVLGKYNAGMVFFKIDQNSIECIKDWRRDTINWCSTKPEDGKFADQAYLNSWPKRYSGLIESPWIGLNLGTWNAEKYKITDTGGRILVDGNRLYCYHFHGFKYYFDKHDRLIPYISENYNVIIYGQYLSALKESYDIVRKIENSFKKGGIENMTTVSRLKNMSKKFLNLIKKR